MVGAGTAAERYGRITKTTSCARSGSTRGLVPDALAVVVAGASTCRPTCRSLNEPDQRVVIATTSEDTLPGVPATSSTPASATTCRA